jgi:large subunit ribosomal protein L21
MLSARGFHDMYALIEFKGKQYKAEKGSLLRVDLLEGEKGSSLDIPSVLLLSDEGKIKVGSPYVAGASVKAVVEDHVKGKKITVFKYIPKKDNRRTHGHRQGYTTIRVQDILGA